MLTLFLAGYETVANALAWTWLLLGQNPEAEARLHAELDTVLGGRLPTLEDMPRLEYTAMVLAESMRLYPPAWAMGREVLEDVSIGPYRLRKGTMVFFSQYIVQRDPRWFPEPLQFRPERFAPEAKAERPRFAYFPFGGGGRQCIGESFALMEATLALATIAQRWRLELVPGQTHRGAAEDYAAPQVRSEGDCGVRAELNLNLAGCDLGVAGIASQSVGRGWLRLESWASRIFSATRRR